MEHAQASERGSALPDCASDLNARVLAALDRLHRTKPYTFSRSGLVRLLRDGGHRDAISRVRALLIGDGLTTARKDGNNFLSEHVTFAALNGQMRLPTRGRTELTRDYNVPVAVLELADRLAAAGLIAPEKGARDPMAYKRCESYCVYVPTERLAKLVAADPQAGS